MYLEHFYDVVFVSQRLKSIRVSEGKNRNNVEYKKRNRTNFHVVNKLISKNLKFVEPSLVNEKEITDLMKICAYF